MNNAFVNYLLIPM